MELKKAKDALGKALKNPKLVRLALLLGLGGILLIYLSSLAPAGEVREEAAEADGSSAAEYRLALERDLARVVRAVTGEEDPQVMITLEDAGRAVYAADSRESQGEASRESESTHVVLEDQRGAQQGLAVAELQPEVKGVVIVSRGAADAALREKLVNAARTALGVPASRVCVVEGI